MIFSFEYRISQYISYAKRLYYRSFVQFEIVGLCKNSQYKVHFEIKENLANEHKSLSFGHIGRSMRLSNLTAMST